MDLPTSLRRAESLIQWLDSAIDGAEIKTTLRSRLSAGCLDIAFEHQKAIVLLVANRLHGSAFAIVRLIFEAYVRGVWLHRCATDDELQRFESGKFDRSFQSLLTQIEQVPGFEAGILTESKRRSWNAMNDFTHTGMIHVSRRHTDTSIEPNYDESEIVEAIGFANAMALMSAIEVSLLAGKETLAQAIRQRSREYADAAE